MIIPSLKITQLLHQPLYIYKIYTIYTLNIEKAPKSFGPKTIIRDLYIPCWSHTRNSEILISLYKLGVVAACRVL